MKDFLKRLGPGIIFAGTCIGVSHLVQSTRAGADYGFTLLWAVLLANLFKFPFFEFAPRYVAATGENLLQGYRRVGRWAFFLFFILTMTTMIPIQAALTLVTTGLLANLVGWSFSLPIVIISAWILIVCSVILILGHYGVLEKFMKLMMVLLTCATLASLVIAVGRPSSVQTDFVTPFQWNLGGISFLVALMGWMPSTIDVSVWHSFWSVEKRKQGSHLVTLKNSLLDFHIGYWATTVLAVCFLALGALVMYGTGETFSQSAVKFTGQIIELYTKTLGPWSFPLIVTAASITMFSTTLSCLDAFPRVISEAIRIFQSDQIGEEQKSNERYYVIAMILLSIASLVVIHFFVTRMKLLIDLVTTVSFLAAPVFAYLNLRAVTADDMPEHARPSKGLQIFSWTGIIFLAGFGFFYLLWRFVLS
jgi:Mn2+/Fe2+ NRAMP family transporter